MSTLPLLSRFQGAFLGGTVGVTWGNSCSQSSKPNLGQFQAFWQSLAYSEGTLLASETEFLDWAAQHLTTHRGLNLELWQAQLPESGWSDHQLMLALLPVMLFYHEDALRLSQRLQQLRMALTHDQIQLDPEFLWDSIWGIGMLCYLCLEPNFSRNTLIANLTRHLQQGSAAFPLQPSFQTDAIQILQGIQELWGKGTSLAHVRLCLPAMTSIPQLQAIAIALYCFLDTPTEVALMLVRAAQAAVQPSLTCGLTGIIAGLQGGIQPWGGRPVGAFSSGSAMSFPPLWQNERLASKLLLAAHLLSVWSGIYSPLPSPQDFTLLTTVTAPYCFGQKRLQWSPTTASQSDFDL